MRIGHLSIIKMGKEGNETIYSLHFIYINLVSNGLDIRCIGSIKGVVCVLGFCCGSYFLDFL